MARGVLVMCVVAALLAAGCVANSPAATHGGLNLDTGPVPLGDGHISTTPKVGYVDSCTNPTGQRPGGKDGPWILGNGTWNPSLKTVTVSGNVTWPSRFNATVVGDVLHITGNGLPDVPTGVYPIRASDDAYAYDKNPNAIKAQTVNLSLPAHPTMASNPSCLPLGPVGIMVSGNYLFDALDADGRDAAAHEIQDACHGHPQAQRVYHFHDLSPCLPVSKSGPPTVVGYALDGFPMVGPWNANGTELHDSDLDACHGTTSPILWNGVRVVTYHYVFTREYPYSLGCYRGTPVTIGQRGNNNP